MLELMDSEGRRGESGLEGNSIRIGSGSYLHVIGRACGHVKAPLRESVWQMLLVSRLVMSKNRELVNGVSINTEVVDITGKIMLIGDSGVGKTCLLVRFKDGAYLAGSYISTVGIDYRNKVVAVDDMKVKLQIWDTAGQERFRSVTHAYYRDAHALLLLYDVSNKTSFDNTRAWLGEIHEYAQEDVVIMLIGNKADMNAERVIRREDGERLAKEYNVAFMETSAKTGMNVELAFMAVARELKARKSTNPFDNKFNVAEYVRTQSEKPGCCS